MTDPDNKEALSVREAGRKGGETTKAKYGPDFYAAIGKKGGEATKQKLGPDHYAEIGKKGGATMKNRAAKDGE